MPIDFNFVNFREAIESITADTLSRAATADDFVHLMKQVHRIAETTLKRNQNKDEAEKIACKKGCGSCCVVNVSVLYPEALTIANHLRTLPEKTLDRIRQKLDNLYRDIRWLDEDERLMLRRPCAFLSDDGACLIHDVRPLICRSVTSTNPQDCRKAVAMNPFEEQATVLMNLFHKNIMEQAFTGLGDGLAQAGFDNRSLELTHAVRQLLNSPESTEVMLEHRKLIEKYSGAYLS